MWCSMDGYEPGSRLCLPHGKLWRLGRATAYPPVGMPTAPYRGRVGHPAYHVYVRDPVPHPWYTLFRGQEAHQEEDDNMDTENLFERVLKLCVGKTVQACGALNEDDGETTGVRFEFTDGTVVQFVYDRDEADFLIQEVEGD